MTARFCLLIGLALTAGSAVQLAPAQASMADCEKIQNWHLYNQCLAANGPKRGQRAARISGGGDPEKTVPSGTGRGGRYGRRASPAGGGLVQRKANGRMSASFDVLGATAGQVKRR